MYGANIWNFSRDTLISIAAVDKRFALDETTFSGDDVIIDEVTGGGKKGKDDVSLWDIVQVTYSSQLNVVATV